MYSICGENLMNKNVRHKCYEHASSVFIILLKSDQEPEYFK